MQRLTEVWNDAEGLYAKIRNSIEPLVKAVPARSSAIVCLFIVLTAVGFLTTSFFSNTVVITDDLVDPMALNITQIPRKPRYGNPAISHMLVKIPLNCTISTNQSALTCPTNNPTTFQPDVLVDDDDDDDDDDNVCPDYFRWIRKDLEPWMDTGITLDVLLTGQPKADFRLIVVDGKAHLETYRRSFQTRDIFTLWGILQLLRRYPGKVPDLDIMFNCGDMPVVPLKNYRGGLDVTAPPVMHYCSDDGSLDIIFPDWSFWGWPEVNIKPWETLSNELREANNKTNWIEREPHAFWKGAGTSKSRQDLMKCNVSRTHDWGARIYKQNWDKATQAGFKQSNLASQCIHRYKIYIEGRAWSVSQKYIMACNSLTLLVKAKYYDFYSRNLMPLEHYWPIRKNDKCRSIEFAVGWGERHKEQAQILGTSASEYMLEDMKMDYVYDYMFHLLNEYAKLLKFKPTVPPGAVELCSETMACAAYGRDREFMIESMVKGSSRTNPCTVPTQYDSEAITSLRKKKDALTKKVKKWEKKYRY